MKHLYILSEYLPDSGGGIITFYANILPQLAARGHRVKVLVANHASLDRAARVEDGVEVEYLQSSFAEQARAGCRKFRNDVFWAFLPLAWGAFYQAKGGEGFDIVETTDWGLLFMPWVVSERKAKVVVSLHGSNGQVDWFSNPEPRSFDGDVVRLAEVAALRLADAIHANSRANAEFWQEKTVRKIQVIPPAYGGRYGKADKLKADLTTEHTENTEMEAGTRLAGQAGASKPDSLASKPADSPVSESLIRSSDAPASSCPASSYSPPATEPKTLKGLVVGRLQNWKGAEILCQALELIDNIQIEWVGGDTLWGNFGETASVYLKKRYPSVWGSKLIWVGPMARAEVLRKMAECVFLVVPSLWDVFNLTAAEGMETGIPVICSKAAGAEMLIEYGTSGFLFDPVKPEELAELLKTVAGMTALERMEMGKMAHGSVKIFLDGEKIIYLLEESYALLIKNDTQPRLDPWLASLLSPALESDVITKMNFAQRALHKVGRIFANA